MEWKKKDGAETIEEVVLRNTKLTEHDFLCPDRMPLVSRLEDALTAVIESVEGGESITIIGDYDADGVTASAILYRLIRYGFKHTAVKVRLPCRFSEGYGLSERIIDEIADGLLVTVDNGIAAIPALRKAKAKGLKVVVLDHHPASQEYDMRASDIADIVVDPHTEEESEFREYCGAGLAYKLACISGCFSEKELEPLSALAAIGTVADVVPLIGDNRNIVIDGLKAMNERSVPKGLDALLDAAALYEMDEDDIAFQIGPMINACGRMEDDGAYRPFELLAYDDYPAALPGFLIETNDKRKIVVRENMERINRIIAEDCLYGDPAIVIYPLKEEEPFPEGIVGILAGKIAESMQVPAIVLTRSSEKGILKGSGRSYGDVDLGQLLNGLSDCLHKHGGHAKAVGLQVKQESAEIFRTRLMEEAGKMEISVSDADEYDLEIETADLPAAVKELNRYAPYGSGNPKPIFKVKNYRLLPRAGQLCKRMGAEMKTIKLFGGSSCVIGFNMADQYDQKGAPTTLDVYGYIQENHFNHSSELQIEMKDFEQALKKKEASPLAQMLASRMRTF